MSGVAKHTNNVHIPNQPTNSAQSERDQEMRQLLNPNAYKNAIGALMQVLSTVAQKELEFRRANANMEVGALQAQTQAAQMQAKSAIMGATAGAAGEGVSATSAIFGAAYGVKGMADASKMHTGYGAKIAEKQAQIKNFRSPTGLGDPSQLPQGAAKEEHIAHLEHEIKELQSRRDQHVGEHTSKVNYLHGLTAVSEGLSKAGSSLGQGQSQAASATASNAKDLAHQVASDIENNSKSNMDVATQALGMRPAEVAVAQVRG